jgi:hypothetical protein
MLEPQHRTDDRTRQGGARVWAQRKGHVENTAESAQAVVTGVKAAGDSAKAQRQLAAGAIASAEPAHT